MRLGRRWCKNIYLLLWFLTNNNSSETPSCYLPDPRLEWSQQSRAQRRPLLWASQSWRFLASSQPDTCHAALIVWNRFLSALLYNLQLFLELSVQVNSSHGKMFHEPEAHLCHRFKGQREHLPHERRELRLFTVVLGGFALGFIKGCLPSPSGEHWANGLTFGIYAIRNDLLWSNVPAFFWHPFWFKKAERLPWFFHLPSLSLPSF